MTLILLTEVLSTILHNLSSAVVECYPDLVRSLAKKRSTSNMQEKPPNEINSILNDMNPGQVRRVYDDRWSDRPSDVLPNGPSAG